MGFFSGRRFCGLLLRAPRGPRRRLGCRAITIRERSASQEDHLIFTLRTALHQCGRGLTLRLFGCLLVRAQLLQREHGALARHDLLRAAALRDGPNREPLRFPAVEVPVHTPKFFKILIFYVVPPSLARLLIINAVQKALGTLLSRVVFFFLS